MLDKQPAHLAGAPRRREAPGVIGRTGRPGPAATLLHESLDLTERDELGAVSRFAHVAGVLEGRGGEAVTPLLGTRAGTFSHL